MARGERGGGEAGRGGMEIEEFGFRLWNLMINDSISPP